MKQILVASAAILSRKVYLSLFLVFIPLVFFVFIFVPAITIPGNSLDFQLAIFTNRDYFLLSTLSLLTSLFLAMQVFIFRNALDGRMKFASLNKGGIGGSIAVVASVFGTASCGACLFALFGFLGANTVFFLVEHQWYVVSGAIILLVISLYFASKKVNGICDVCIIDKTSRK